MERIIAMLLLVVVLSPVAVEANRQNMQDPLVKVRLAIEAELRNSKISPRPAVEVPAVPAVEVPAVPAVEAPAVPAVEVPVERDGIPAIYRGALLMLWATAVMMAVVYIHTRP